MITKRILAVVTFSLICCDGKTQSAYKPSFETLKQYEGTYEYKNNVTLQMVVSPKDTILYALIGDGRYKLTSFDKDVFLDGGKHEVRFVASSQGYGYKIKDETPDQFYKRLSANVTADKRMWSARPEGSAAFRWRYHKPAVQSDGLETGLLSESGLDTALIHLLVNRIVDGTYPEVHSVLIMKDGKLVLEEYFYDYDINTKHQLRSATKSFTGALVGIATDKHFIKQKNQTVLSFFPEYKIENPDARKNAITIENLLTQQSGFACNDHDGNSPGNETKIYPTHDWIKTLLDLPMSYEPGHEAQYCSGNVLVLNRIVEKATHQPLHSFAKENLFDKLGVKDFDWDFVPDETHQASFSQLHLRPRDMLKFGKLYLDGGKWNGEQIISKTWTDATFKQQSTVDGIGYSYLWWCENLTANGKVFHGVAAKGNGGQRIFIWPDENMIAVVTAGNYNAQSPANKLLIECVLSGVRPQ
jgi:CubicO group peptidase (beta-lactamase class C family)